MTDTSAAPSELLSAEGLGQLLAATTRCHEATSELGRRVDELGARVERHSRANREMIAELRSELAEAHDAKLDAIQRSIDDLAKGQKELAAAQKDDDITRAKGSALLAAGRWIVGLTLPFAIGGVAYLYNGHAAQATHLARHDDAIAAVRDDAERHERAPSHSGSQQRLSDLSGDLRALTVRIEELRSSVDRMADQRSRAPSMRPPRR